MKPGALRIADWMTDAAHPDEVVHAYLASGPIPFRGVCGNGHWTVKSARVETGPLCQVCREIVQGCATRTLDEIVAMEWAESQAGLAAAMDVPENEMRALFGDR